MLVVGGCWWRSRLHPCDGEDSFVCRVGVLWWQNIIAYLESVRRNIMHGFLEKRWPIRLYSALPIILFHVIESIDTVFLRKLSVYCSCYPDRAKSVGGLLGSLLLKIQWMSVCMNLCSRLTIGVHGNEKVGQPQTALPLERLLVWSIFDEDREARLV